MPCCTFETVIALCKREASEEAPTLIAFRRVAIYNCEWGHTRNETVPLPVLVYFKTKHIFWNTEPNTAKQIYDIL